MLRKGITMDTEETCNHAYRKGVCVFCGVHILTEGSK